MDGTNALDASAVHPEAYPVVKNISATTGRDIKKLIGDSETLSSLDPNQFTDEQFGLPTVKDILKELDKPGRDPRPEFKTATFKEGIEKISDLKTDMVLEGVVSNVTHFGAFVDIGVHQDGLVHISALADKFVKDPHDVVSAGDVVKVKVVEIDESRKRIALTMKLQDTPAREKPPKQKNSDERNQQHRGNTQNKNNSDGAKRRKPGTTSRSPGQSSGKSSGRSSGQTSEMGSFGEALQRAKQNQKK